MAHFARPQLEKPKDFNFARDVVDYWAARNPDSVAMYWVSQDLSETRMLKYSHFERQSHQVAILLQKLGLSAGDRLVMILPRTPAWWEIALASIRSGIVICPATTLLVAKDIEFRCKLTGATAFFGDKTSVEKFMKVKGNCPTVKVVVQADETPKASDSTVIDYYQRLELVEESASFRSPPLGISDPSLIYFTSGTSGPPKMISLRSLSNFQKAHTLTGKHWLQLSPGKVYWNLSEQGWAKAAWSFFGTWNCGATLFVHDDRSTFDPLRLLHILHKYPITTLCAPPTAYRQLVLQESKKFLKENPPKALSHCTGAGEPLNASVIDEWQKMTGMEIFDGYGQTETVLMCGNFAGTAIRPGSMGKPTPGVPLKIISSDGRECEHDTEGDLAIFFNGNASSSGQFFGLFDGYIRPDGTLDKRIKELGGKEWYLMGDRATRDRDGYYWFVGRADDVINSAGYRIGPFEVESTLKLHPGVAESAVVSSPDESRGEVVKAFVVLTSEFKESKDDSGIVKELQDFCKGNAAPYKYPRKIQLVDPDFLPKTISGKIKRNELKAAEWKKGKDSKL
ncbi:acetyl-CoA synthetase [Cadophora sp. DSE1049]|nr:acetyl-CoA synthetase [Cadophora sp. DSE1049]